MRFLCSPDIPFLELLVFYLKHIGVVMLITGSAVVGIGIIVFLYVYMTDKGRK